MQCAAWHRHKLQDFIFRAFRPLRARRRSRIRALRYRTAAQGATARLFVPVIPWCDYAGVAHVKLEAMRIQENAAVCREVQVRQLGQMPLHHISDITLIPHRGLLDWNGTVLKLIGGGPAAIYERMPRRGVACGQWRFPSPCQNAVAPNAIPGRPGPRRMCMICPVMCRFWYESSPHKKIPWARRASIPWLTDYESVTLPS